MKIAGLIFTQPAKGYRFSIDPFLLAAFVRPRPGERLLDLGCGVGVIALLLARRSPSLRVFALEIQRDLALLAGENTRRNGLSRRCFTILGDLRHAAALFPPDSFHRVVTNPPYRAPGAGRISPHPGRALARHEHGFTIEHLARVVATILRPGGSLDIIHLAERLPEIVRAFSAHRLEIKTLRLVSSYPGSAPRLALLSARKGGRPGLAVLPQLVIRDSPGRYHPEVAEALDLVSRA